MTWLMVGPAGPIIPEPQPKQKMMSVRQVLAAIVLIALPKSHPKK
jgi:hypothetical protein